MSLSSLTTPLQPGQSVFYGRYSLVRLIGRGGTGLVWLALDRELGVHRALKFVTGIEAESEVEWGTLRQEAARAQRLTHDHIVRVYDSLHAEGLGALAMEYIDGVTLKQLQAYRPGRCFDVDDIRPWVAQLCEALGYAHGHGIVHLDLKPSNLMVNSRAQLKVTDFGIAQCLAEPGSARGARAKVAGTPAFMSPQRLELAPPGTADDVYAFGATLFALLSGKSPAHGRHLSLARTRSEIGCRHQAPVPEPWESVIRSCLEQRPENRPADLAEIAAVLDLQVANRGTFPSPPDMGVSILEVQSNLRGEGDRLQGDEEADVEETRTVLIKPRGNRFFAQAGRAAVAAVAALAMLGGLLMTKFVSAHRAEPDPVAASPERRGVPGPVTPAGPRTRTSVERLDEMNASLQALEKAADAPGAQIAPIVRFLTGRTFTETMAPFQAEAESGTDPRLNEKLASIYVSRAYLQVKLSRVSQALQDLHHALEIYPCFPPALELRGKLTHHDGDDPAGCIG